MNLSDTEIAVLQGILSKHVADLNGVAPWPPRYAGDPVVAALQEHRPVRQYAGNVWGCSCNIDRTYVSESHVLATHVRPYVEKAATLKVREILDRAGMDLDVIINSDKIFGGER